MFILPIVDHERWSHWRPVTSGALYLTRKELPMTLYTDKDKKLYKAKRLTIYN